MFKYLLVSFFCFSSWFSFSQITGQVTNKNGEKLPYVNIYIENTFTGTTSNQDGNYALEIEQKGEMTVVFQFLGYKTLKKKITVNKFPHSLNASLVEESTSLDEVVLKSNENPANRVIRKAIEFRKENKLKIQQYTADFYSRGLWKIEDAPEKILGAEVGDLGGSLDSTRSGIIYLSETISKIKYQAPDNFHEKISASKVSGDDNGFSINSARDANFSFYDNTIEINAKVVSPIAEYAFNYYKYELDGIFYDENQKLINKIKVIPKRKKDRVFSGYIYIVEDEWQIYGIDLTTTGSAIQVEPIEEITFKQNFTYSTKDKLWVKLSQKVDFSWKIFGIKGNGRFNAAYSNYNFKPDFSENTFSKEILSFTENANKKDSLYWQEIRPIPLTEEEANDYVKKDSIQEIRSSKKYKDSVDTEHNRFNVGDILFGYHWADSYNGLSFDISAPVSGIQFNTVQGWNLSLDTYFRKEQEDNQKYWELFSSMNYGFADQRYRMTGGFRKKFNNKSRPYLTIEGGVEAKQINDTEPIRPIVSTIASVLFDKNYLKLYDRSFIEASYSEELFNGFRLYATASFERRNPLFDDVDIIEDEEEYTANNPLQPNNFNSTPFEEHNIAKLRVTGRINFDQKYYNYPDGKYNVSNSNYPTLYATYEKGFASSIEAYNFDHFMLTALQSFDLQNKGDLSYSIKGGAFFNAEDISYVDFKHFNGNLTHVKLSETITQFNLLPYYGLSTNEEYGEFHLEHNFQGWILGKIPFINKLNFNMVAGINALWTTGNKPYSEYSVGMSNIGIGKFRFLRVDYVRAYNGSWQDDGVMFGISIGL